MSNFFEQLLKEKSSLQSSNDLWIQWETSKTFVPSILSMVVNIFPHYSMHDTSHSETILDNILKILGKEQISRLSATDLWMLLFTAYFHDVGMFVSKDDIINLIENEKFINFVKEQQNETKSDLNIYANCYDIIDNSIYYKQEKITPESFNSLKFLFAGYLRQEHSKRSKTAIESFNTSSFIYIPKTIPLRIIETVADICCLHTANDFSDILNMPKIENGVFGDYCHPRFIACMLRLGDVLDIDNNRFSAVVLSTLPSIPTDSLKHIKKHLSIKKLYLSQTEISVIANCDDEDVGDLTTSWFKWISNEISIQSKNWQEIIPESTFSALPKIKQLDVNIKDFDSVNGNDRPRFTFGTDKALQIIQGSGVYNTKFIFIREILQNAIDATLIRIYIENRDKLENLSLFKEICKNEKYSITISIDSNKDDDSILNFSFKDNGIGIDNEDFKYILSSGNKGKNSKLEVINEMKEWMKPSGIFGIGLHSIFLITDKFEINTAKLNSGHNINGILYSPTSDKKGAVYLHTEKSKLDSKVGTEIKFTYKSTKFPDAMTFNNRSNVVYENYASFDFIKNPNVNFELAQIIDEISNFAYTSYLPIMLRINGKLMPLNEDSFNFDISDENNNFEFSIRKPGYINKVFYRNQLLIDFRLRETFFSVFVNILSGNAKDKLLMSRNDLKSEYKNQFYKELNKSLISVFIKKFSKLDDDAKPFIGMCLELETNENGEPEWRKAWKQYKISINKNEFSMEQLIEIPEIIIKNNLQSRLQEENSYDKNKLTLIDNNFEDPIVQFFHNYCTKMHYHLSWYVDNNSKEAVFVYSKDKRYPIINFEDLKKSELIFAQVARSLIPCEDKYVKLALSTDYIKSIGYKNIVPGCFYGRDIPFMALPYITKKIDNKFYGKLIKSDDEDFYQCVFKNRCDKSVEIKEIKELYNEFMKENPIDES